LAMVARVLVVPLRTMHLREDPELHGASLFGPPRAEFVVANYHSYFRIVNPNFRWYSSGVRKKAKDEARKARNDVYRQHILEAAEEVFAQKGFEAAKLQDIGTRAGLSMGTIYAIFPGKTELFTAILEERGRELADLVEAIARAGTSPREALDRLIEVYIGWFVE